eukprot:TRINITY_DN29_c0_g1_i2.p1 TRINITY_DN29_c0_g1~~TRINITY_DN29_c0_g1_i2.p1  ORF type:complete len:854 (-),score=199.57 TRINITY_DN29_c0_g1_i2:64-2625(-)
MALLKKKGFAHCASLDIGTFGSGYAIRDINGEVLVQTEWAGSGSLKTQTDLVVDQDGNLLKFGTEAAEYYAEVKDQPVEFYSKFKMRIFNPDDADPLCSSVNGLTTRPVTFLLQKTMEFLSQEVLEALRKSFPNVTRKEVRWVVTIPAIWTPAAKLIVRKAAKQAGLWTDLYPDQLVLCLEPEAAALDCLDVLSGPEFKLEGGDQYVLCDAGGGTADFVVHQIAGEGKVVEVLSASGGPWGSTYVNRAFEEKLESIFGTGNIANFKETYPADWIKLTSSFESEKIKKRNGITAKKISIKVMIPNRFVDVMERLLSTPFSAICSQHRGISFDDALSAMVFDHGACVTLLDATITKMCEHTQQLMRSPKVSQLKAIVLVGGYAESSFLKDRLKLLAHNAGVLFYCPRDPSLAIVKGALKFGQAESSISARVSPMSFGIEISRPFQPSDPEDCKIYNLKQNKHLCTHVYEELVPMDSLVQSDSVIRRIYVGYESTVKVPIFAYKKSTPSGKYVTDDGMELLTELELEFKNDRGGQTSLEVQMLFGGTELQVSVVEKSAQGTENITYQSLQSVDSWKSVVASNLQLQKHLNLACKFEDEVTRDELDDFKMNFSTLAFEYGKDLEEFSLLIYKQQGGRYNDMETSLNAFKLKWKAVSSESEFMSQVNDYDEAWILCSPSRSPSNEFLQCCVEFVNSFRGLAIWTWSSGSPTGTMLLEAIFGDKHVKNYRENGTYKNGVMKLCPENRKLNPLEFSRHLLFSGLPELYEGTKVSNFKDDQVPEDMEVVALNSDGRPTILVAQAKGSRGRIVYDTSITKMCNCCRKNVVGVDRYCRNMCTWLLGLEDRAQMNYPLKGPVRK